MPSSSNMMLPENHVSSLRLESSTSAILLPCAPSVGLHTCNTFFHGPPDIGSPMELSALWNMILLLVINNTGIAQKAIVLWANVSVLLAVKLAQRWEMTLDERYFAHRPKDCQQLVQSWPNVLSPKSHSCSPSVIKQLGFMYMYNMLLIIRNYFVFWGSA